MNGFAFFVNFGFFVDVLSEWRIYGDGVTGVGVERGAAIVGVACGVRVVNPC